MSNTTTLSKWIKEKKRRNIRSSGDIDVLRQIATKLEEIHRSGRFHGNLSLKSILIEESGCTVTSFGDEEGTDAVPEVSLICLKQKDIFEFGCICYQVLSGGAHPFGCKEDRKQLIALNIYGLSWCEGENDILKDKALCQLMKKLIKKMISFDPNQRPSIDKLQECHPVFWTTKAITDYLIKEAKRDSGLSSTDSWQKDVWLSPVSHSCIEDIMSVHKILENLKKVCFIND